MTTALCAKRLERELIALRKSPPELLQACPLEKDIRTWMYVMDGSPDTPFAGGQYIGMVKFPAQYPYKPPDILMLTPNGRFKPGEKICMSMTSFHPESWEPSWGVTTILLGLQSFMVDDDPAAGALFGPEQTSTSERRRLAAASRAWNRANSSDFVRLFPEAAKLPVIARSPSVAVAAAAGSAGAAGAADSDLSFLAAALGEQHVGPGSGEPGVGGGAGARRGR